MTTISDDEFVLRLTGSQRELKAFIFALVPHQGDADDLLQEVNIALWRKRHLYDKNQKFMRWATGFASLEVRSFRSRSAKSKLCFSDNAIEALAGEWPNTVSFADDCRHALATCIQKLGRKERRIIEDRYTKGLSVKEIAAESDKPISTVYKILGRAHEALCECVKRTQIQSNQ
ncbi:ECF RNA polymerase sigma-E factor [Stieleria maiorica]|uniref:ECF RNA polymerase sigma-E factor n=1 Tax=Stieleria maiorica TaxID=2795974 RepID=A0A5B9M995_9BACT|nr:sigma-70 family RNA polymerase sigma factor [Stieleria maiorica]QEF97253.1 ECF RNA polymerase sigma-E factor [Stieleria maiorica]